MTLETIKIGQRRPAVELESRGLPKYRAQSTASCGLLTNTGTRLQAGLFRTLVSMLTVCSRMLGGVISICGVVL